MLMEQDVIERVRPYFASRDQVGTLLGGISTRTVDRLIERGELTTKAVGGRRMVTMESVLTYVGVSA